MPKISAPPWQVQLFFQDKDGGGWSEFWWWHGTSYQDTLDSWTSTVLGNMLDLRLAMVCPSISCTYTRVSDSTVKRDTLVKAYTLDQGKGTYEPTAGTDSMPGEVAVLLRLQGVIADAPVFTLKPLRGIPEDCVLDGVYNPTLAFSSALNDFISSFTGQGRIVLKTGDTVTETAVDSIVAMHMSRRKTGRPFGLSRGRLMRP